MTGVFLFVTFRGGGGKGEVRIVFCAFEVSDSKYDSARRPSYRLRHILSLEAFGKGVCATFLTDYRDHGEHGCK